MIKNLSVVLVSAALLSACGGSDNKKTTPITPPVATSSSVVSSVPASSIAPASSSIASSLAPESSSSVLSSSSTPTCEDTTVQIYPNENISWAGNWGSTLTSTDSTAGLVVNFLKGEESIVFKQPSTTKLGNAIFTLEFQTSPEFKGSDGFFEIMAQENADPYAGKFAAISNKDLTTDATNTLSITLDDTELFNKNVEKQLGLMAKNPNGGLASGTVTIVSATLTFPNTACGNSSEASSNSSSSESSSSDAPAEIPPLFKDSFATGIDGWSINGNIDTPEMALTYNATLKALVATPKTWASTDNWRYSVRYTFPTSLKTASGKTATVIASIPQAYIDENMQFQIIAGSQNSEYSNYLPAGTPVDGKYEFTYDIGTTAGANLTFIGFQPATVATTKTNLGAFTIHSVTIK